jgi:predicted tellurium resistance membrane protein TerC
MAWLSDPNAWLGLLTLSALEIVLGIDNIIFISILAGKLPAEDQGKARQLGLAGAFLTRLGLIFSIAWIVTLTKPLIHVANRDFSGRDLVLLFGGLFLMFKATREIHGKLEGPEQADETTRAYSTLWSTVAMIMVIDIVFSLDSVITAVGMVNQVEIMVAANVVALLFMLVAAGPIARFVDDHPTVKMLALSFLVLIGSNLVAESFGHHIPKGYTYFAMAFSVLVEMLNLRVKGKKEAVQLRESALPPPDLAS